MPVLPILGLLIALLAVPLVLEVAKRLDFSSWALAPRLALWLSAGALLAIAAKSVNDWRAPFGVGHITWGAIGWGILAVAITFAVMSAYLYIQRRLGKRSQQLEARYQALLRLPFWHRCFIVVTAAVTEEFLYRGYAVGIGAHLLGGLWVAGVISVAAFTLAHFRWGLAHLIPVFISAVVFTVLFALTRNLWVCILAHAVVDGVGFLVMPIATRHRVQLGSNAG